MPAPIVPDTTAIRRNRVRNIDTDRLVRRAARLRAEIADPCHHYPGGRHGFAMRAAELTAINAELDRRGT